MIVHVMTLGGCQIWVRGLHFTRFSLKHCYWLLLKVNKSRKKDLISYRLSFFLPFSLLSFLFFIYFLFLFLHFFLLLLSLFVLFHKHLTVITYMQYGRNRVAWNQTIHFKEGQAMHIATDVVLQQMTSTYHLISLWAISIAWEVCYKWLLIEAVRKQHSFCVFMH